MTRDDIRHQGDATLRRNIRQAHEARVRDIVQVDQLTEVGVYRDQDSPRRLSECQQSPVPGVRAKQASLKDIVLACAKRLRETAPGASIDQKSHDSATETVASVSRAMTACA